ncbi:MAG: alpha/beta hydrolase [Candidatus Metalachnospira sp.]|nr:alpha/beta hydrolase [Candidatus Metalachnospira sp.]
MSESYLEKNIDTEFTYILSQPPAYLGAWSSEKIIRKIGRDIIYPPISVPADPQVKVTEQMIPGPKGAPEIQIRVYEPKIRTGILPGLLYFHYGGYTIGSPTHEDAMCYRYVKEVGCVIISPAYRLAPENPAPAAYEDCYATLLWFVANASIFSVDPLRIAVTGLSSGGGLTIAVCLMARDRGGPMPIFQLPVAPTIDDRLRTKSSTEFKDPRALNYNSCRQIWNFYLGKGHENRDDISPYAAPSRATDLSGLPPCYCYVGGLDPHRDETIALIARLTQADVQTGFSLYPGGIHAFQLELPDARISRHAISTAIHALKYALYPNS